MEFEERMASRVDGASRICSLEWIKGNKGMDWCGST